MGLLRGLFWLALFVFFTFCFLVLFEYGPNDFVNGFQKEGERIEKWVDQKVHPPKKPDNP
ncbi:MAG: hypothetical protein H0X40_01385 [Chthoniobacterales bacterium]|nr:hypothetical protein [Chthoniobacterales bacterium]